MIRKHIDKQVHPIKNEINEESYHYLSIQPTYFFRGLYSLLCLCMSLMSEIRKPTSRISKMYSKYLSFALSLHGTHEGDEKADK